MDNFIAFLNDNYYHPIPFPQWMDMLHEFFHNNPELYEDFCFCATNRFTTHFTFPFTDDEEIDDTNLQILESYFPDILEASLGLYYLDYLTSTLPVSLKS